MLPRYVRAYLLGCIALAFAYLVLHAREPLRLSLGDPSSDANLLSLIKSDSAGSLHRPPLADLLYATMGRHLGVGDIGTFRLFALVFSVLAIVLLYQWARRIWNETIALVAAALVATSLLWMMFADSLQMPIMQASGFLALWGLVRAIETKQRRHYAAAFVGAWACYLTSYDYWVFLPAAVLFTVHIKLGNPLAKDNLRFVGICAAGCAAGLLAKVLFATGGAGWHEILDPKPAAALPTLLRRYTLVFTPMVWVTLAITTWRTLRAPSWRAVLDDGVTWMLVVAAVVLFAYTRRPGPPVLGAQQLLPFYAFGSAVLIARLLEGRWLRRGIAMAWIAVAPVWAGYLMLRHPRALLDRDDVAKVNGYLAANDRNDFVLSNLLSDVVIQASFDRHTWAANDAADTTAAVLKMQDVFEATGTDYVHAVIFTTPDSRFIEPALARLIQHRPLYAVTGWPDLNRAKTTQLIGEYDKNVLANLDKVHAKRVLHLTNFDVYRIDRAGLIEAAGEAVPMARAIDFGSVASNRFKLLGWGEPWLTKDGGPSVTSIDGFAPCPNPAIEHGPGEPGGNACETVPTRNGLKTLDEGRADRAQLMLRVERACDLRLTLELAAPALLRLSVNDFTTSQCAPAQRVEFVIPQRSVHAGINVLTFERRFGKKTWRADVASLAIDPICAP